MRSEQVAIKRIVAVTEEYLRAAVATLGDVVRITGDDDTRETGHPAWMSHRNAASQLSAPSPQSVCFGETRSIRQKDYHWTPPSSNGDVVAYCPQLRRRMEMKRRDFVAMIIGGVTASPLIARAEQGKNIPRVGYIDPETRSSGIQGLLAGLDELGYVDGRNIKLIKRQFAAPTVADMRAAILAIIRDVDILVVSGTVGGVAAKSVTSEVPVVFISVGAPVDIGLVKSLAKPGGNMTEIVSGVSHVAILGAAGDPNFVFAMASLKRSAPGLGVSITPFEIKTADDLGQAFDEMKRAQVQAVLVVAGYLTYSSIKKTADLALSYYLPSCHG